MIPTLIRTTVHLIPISQVQISMFYENVRYAIITFKTTCSCNTASGRQAHLFPPSIHLISATGLSSDSSTSFNRALGEVTNVPKVPPKDPAPLSKVKNEEKEKWWTLGRGRKDSKEKTKENKENKMSSKRKSSPMNPCFISVLTMVSQL
jgi:hypothetical protein